MKNCIQLVLTGNSRVISAYLRCVVILSTVLTAWLAQAQFGPGIPKAIHSNASADVGGDFSPRLATDGNGNWISVWSSQENLNGTAGTDADILVARSSDHGQSWSAPQVLVSNANSDSGADFSPLIKTDGNGRWIVVWHSDEDVGSTHGTDRDIYFSISTDSGVTWSPLLALNSDAATDTRSDSNPALETDRKGNWIASWHAVGGGSFGTDQEIWFARSGDGGNTWSAPAPLNNNATTDSGDDFSVSLATDWQGTWIAVWSSNEDLSGPADFDNDIAFARSVDNGLSWSAPAFLDSNATIDNGEDFNPQIVTDRQGGWVVAWESGASLGGTIGTDQDILFVRSTNNGVTWSASAALNASATNDSELDSFPSLATDAHGVWVAIWHSAEDLNGGIGDDQDLLAAYSTDHGATWSAPAPLASNAANKIGDDNSPHLATDESGNWMVVWSSSDSLNGTIGTDDDILYVGISNPLLWTKPAVLNDNAATDIGNDFSPRIVADDKGNAVAVWMSNENLNGTAGLDLDIFFSRSSDNGQTWSATGILNSNANTDAGDDRDARLATDGKGRWIAVWGSTENLNNQIGTDGDILFSVSTDSGATWSAPALLNSTGTNDAVGDFNPSIATDRAGNWVAVWGTTGAYGSDFDVVTASSFDGGITWSVPAPLNTNAANDDGDDFDPQIATDGQGLWMAVWMSNAKLVGLGYDLGTDDDILVAYSADNGITWTAPRPLNNNAASDGGNDDDYTPQIATDGNGNWIVVWHSEGTLGGTLATNLNILYSRSTNNGANWSSVAALNRNAVSDDGDDYFPQIATDRKGRWLATWHSDERGLGGDPGVFMERDIVIATSFDEGMTWLPPAPLNTDGFLDDNDDHSVHPAIGAGGKWIAVWSSMPDLLGANSDVKFATAFLPNPTNSGVAPLQVARTQTSGSPANMFTMNWAGGLPPFQVQNRTSLGQGSWANAGNAICDRSASFPIIGSQEFFRVLSLGDNTQPHLAWLDPALYLQGTMSAVAETIFVQGFGIDDTVDVLVSGALPITVQRTLINNSRSHVAAGYLVQEQLLGWTFLAVGGSAGYVPGNTNLQLVFECETTNTPALAPGQTAVIEFILGGPDCPPFVPIAALPCGLYQEKMTVVAPTIVAGFCTNTTDIVADNFLFVNETNIIRITSTLNPDSDPNVSVMNKTVNVFAVPDAPVRTHLLEITTTPPTLSYFVRGRSPIFGNQAPTQGAIVPAIPQSPAAPLLVTGASSFDYYVTVVPSYNGIPSCTTILPPSYFEKVNTTLTAISTNGCSIAQESIFATGIYECNF